MRGKLILLVSLLIATFLSAISVVYIKHYNRKLFVEVQQLEKQRDEMEIEWGKLQLEQNTHATHSIIESRARKDLNMYIPKAEDVIYLKLKSP